MVLLLPTAQLLTFMSRCRRRRHYPLELHDGLVANVQARVRRARWAPVERG